MTEGKAKLVIDLGNSETRVMTIYGKTKSGKSRYRLSTISNKFGLLPNKRLLNNPDYNELNSKVFVVGDDDIFCSGEMCDKEKGKEAQRPSASVKKYDSSITLYTLRLALLQGYLDISDMTKQSMDSVDVVWEISVLLPPSDLELGSEKIRQSILGLKSIKFLMPDFEKEINVSKVRVYPEGFCAFVGVVFENGSKIRKGYKDIMTSATLVIDIGAGTTDLCIIKDMKLVDGSRYTEDTGGNQVFQKVNVELRKKFGKNFPEDSLRIAAVKGVIKVGARDIDITREVEVARKDVATLLSTSIKSYIESSSFSVLDIANILICGGGAEEYEGSSMKTLGDYLREELMLWMPYSDFIKIPTVEKEEDDEGLYTETKISPRLLNIIGAGVLSEN